PSYGHRNIMNRAKSLTMSRICVMKTSAKIAAKSISQRRLPRQNRAARGQPACFHRLPRIRNLQFHDFARGECACLELLHPRFRVHAEYVLVPGGLGTEKIARGRDSFLYQRFRDQVKFLRWKNMLAEV